MTTDTTTMDIHDILKRLPHRYPILLVDRVVELAQMGCDGIISDWPERLVEARDRLR